MSDNPLSLGCVCYVRRPTRAVIEAKQLDVHRIKSNKKHINTHIKIKKPGLTLDTVKKKTATSSEVYSTVVNGFEVDDNYFNTTVFYVVTPTFLWVPEAIMEKAGVVEVIVLDKERVKNKDSIAHLVNKTIMVPEVLLQLKDRVIDMRKFPTSLNVSTLAAIRHRETGSRIDSFIRKYSKTKCPADFVAEGRRSMTVGTSVEEHKLRNTIDTDILTRSSSRSEIQYSTNTGFSVMGSVEFIETTMYCTACFRPITKDKVLSGLSKNPKKRSPGKGKISFSCPYCATLYAVFMKNDRAVFEQLDKEKNATVMPLKELAFLETSNEHEVVLRLKARHLLGLLTEEEYTQFTKLFPPGTPLNWAGGNAPDDDDDDDDWDDDDD